MAVVIMEDSYATHRMVQYSVTLTPRTQYYSTLNISKMVQDGDIVTMEY